MTSGTPVRVGRDWIIGNNTCVNHRYGAVVQLPVSASTKRVVISRARVDCTGHVPLGPLLYTTITRRCLLTAEAPSPPTKPLCLAGDRGVFALGVGEVAGVRQHAAGCLELLVSSSDVVELAAVGRVA